MEELGLFDIVWGVGIEVEGGVVIVEWGEIGDMIRVL